MSYDEYEDSAIVTGSAENTQKTTLDAGGSQQVTPSLDYGGDVRRGKRKTRPRNLNLQLVDSLESRDDELGNIGSGPHSQNISVVDQIYSLRENEEEIDKEY